MKKLLFFLIAILLLIILTAILMLTVFKPTSTNNSPQTNAEQTVATQTNRELTEIAQGLDTPWAIAFLPTGGMLVTERPGKVRFIDANNTLQAEPVAELAKVKEIGEGGLLGIALDPDFATSNFVYLYYTYDGAGSNTRNRVVRMTFTNNTLKDEKVLLDTIPGSSNHNGGRIIFGPDGYLYIGTGDAEEPSQAQNTKTLGGKILRITKDGKAAPGNPFNNPVYSYGHRNVQGLAFDSQGRLWATEHGRSGAASGLDEVNLIMAGKNYGWPEIEGDETRSGMVTSVLNSGATTTWAPAGTVIIGDRIYFGGLRGTSIYTATINGNTLSDFSAKVNGEYGRIREVTAGPDGLLYFSTSNRDGRGRPSATDDRILRVDPLEL